MSFGQSITTCFGKYIDWNGRALRSEYWFFYLFLIILNTLSGTIDSQVFGTPFTETGTVGMIVSLGTLLPSLCVTIRRLHDVDKSGWWILIAFTCVGLIPLIVWLASAGSSGSNRYGEEPSAEGPAE